MEKVKKYIPFVYIILLVLAFTYVRGILDQEELDVDVKDNDKEVHEVKPADVTLEIRGFQTNFKTELRLENTKTFDDLLELLVKEGKLTYEKTEYIYGTVYDNFNGEEALEEYSWHIYANGEEITLNTKGYKLEDEGIYNIVLEKE